MNHKRKVQHVAFTKFFLGLMLVQMLVFVTGFQTFGKPASLSSSRLVKTSIFKPRHCPKLQLLDMVSNINNLTYPSVITRVDTSAIVKYFIALGTQISLFGFTFHTMDLLLYTLFQINAKTIPTPFVWFLFYAISLKSRIFSPLNNSRPTRLKANYTSMTKNITSSDSTDTKTIVKKGFNDRIMPKWTPPGPVFPIVWLLIISPLRATASTLILQQAPHFFTLPIMSLILHLSIGDVWNTINNTERRYGTSVLGVVAVWFSAVHAAYQYYQVSPLAGRLLGATCIWLSIAATLIGQTWRLNPSSIEGKKRDPFLPMISEGEKSKTQFTWIR